MYLRMEMIYEPSHNFLDHNVRRERERENDFVLLLCRSLFVPLYFLFRSLCCLSFFDIRIMITHLVSSNSSCVVYSIDGNTF